ncbi:MAG TPA: hypothetical protein QGF02_02805 [Candidatus Babeliales bacterium]|nr:hypothetical protein [Candidatus Babeliales bacterium]
MTPGATQILESMDVPATPARQEAVEILYEMGYKPATPATREAAEILLGVMEENEK